MTIQMAFGFPSRPSAVCSIILVLIALGQPAIIDGVTAWQIRKEPFGLTSTISFQSAFSTSCLSRPSRKPLPLTEIDCTWAGSHRAVTRVGSPDCGGPLVGRTLTLLHARPANAWTVELATETGASRSVLADRFGNLVGCAPIQHLTGVAHAVYRKPYPS